MHSSLSVCAASCGLHAREGEEGTLKDMPCNETKVMFVAETRDLKLEPSTCTVSLPFVETPMAGIRGKEKRAPLKTRDATRENESSLLKLELNTRSGGAAVGTCLQPPEQWDGCSGSSECWPPRGRYNGRRGMLHPGQPSRSHSRRS